MPAKRPTPLDLPTTVANEVLEKPEIEELMTCRKVCRSLRTAVDRLGANFTDLEVILNKNNQYVSICLDGITVKYSKSSRDGTDV